MGGKLEVLIWKLLPYWTQNTYNILLNASILCNAQVITIYIYHQPELEHSIFDKTKLIYSPRDAIGNKLKYYLMYQNINKRPCKRN